MENFIFCVVSFKEICELKKINFRKGIKKKQRKTEIQKSQQQTLNKRNFNVY